jgi:hypothetical protein
VWCQGVPQSVPQIFRTLGIHQAYIANQQGFHNDNRDRSGIHTGRGGARSQAGVEGSISYAALQKARIRWLFQCLRIAVTPRRLRPWMP